MKKNTIIQFIVTGMFLFGATACTGNFEDYNKNPHEPDQNDMGVDWYLVRSLALNLQDLMMPEQENFSQYVDCFCIKSLINPAMSVSRNFRCICPLSSFRMSIS